jgi:hypothetical protein
MNQKTKQFQEGGMPVILVDTKKKENLETFKNAGSEYQPKGDPVAVNVHDFVDKNKGKAAPYGIYDITKDKGCVSVGISSDTAAFAVNNIKSWRRWVRSVMRVPTPSTLMRMGVEVMVLE